MNLPTLPRERGEKARASRRTIKSLRFIHAFIANHDGERTPPARARVFS